MLMEERSLSIFRFRDNTGIFQHFSSSPQDTGGSYVDDFPAMVELSLQSADAVLLGKSTVKFFFFSELLFTV